MESDIHDREVSPFIEDFLHQSPGLISWNHVICLSASHHYRVLSEYNSSTTSKLNHLKYVPYLRGWTFWIRSYKYQSHLILAVSLDVLCCRHDDPSFPDNAWLTRLIVNNHDPYYSGSPVTECDIRYQGWETKNHISNQGCITLHEDFRPIS